VKVTLRKIDYEHFHEVIELELHEDQEKHLPSNLYSLAESSFSDSFHPRAIWCDEEIVGFTMHCFGEDEDDKHECVIWRFMIAREHQNRGIGKLAMDCLMDDIKTNDQCKVIEIYYDEENIAAKKLYNGFGFEVVGQRDDGDAIAIVRV